MQSMERPSKIKPPLSAETKEDALKALKAELELELKNKKQCMYQPYECTQLTLDGYKYCLKHILQDKSAPFKQCSYVYASNGKRCQAAAPKVEKKDVGYCNEHALRATLIKNRQNSRYPPPQTAEVLLSSLSHYVKKPRNRTLSSSTVQSDDTEKSASEEAAEQKTTKGLDPFSTWQLDTGVLVNSSHTNILDLCSESDSDVEPSNFSSVWHDAQIDSSDNESIDSEQEDILKHANVYTAEEISLITRDKLIKLQSLYIEQYRHLQHVFKERKRKYVHGLKREKETCCNIYNQIRENPKEQRLYKKLKAYNKYHKTHGVEAILNKRMHDSRAKITDGILSKPSSYTKCMFTEGGVKCGERTLPLARHCRKHILEDSHQVLFRPCGKTKADVECTTPVEAIFEDVRCRLHMDIPPIKSYSQLRKNSESDFDDSFDAMENMLMDASNDLTDLSTSSNVKTELIDYRPHMSKTVPSMLFEETSLEYFDHKSDFKAESVDVEDGDLVISADERTCDTDDMNIEIEEPSNICDSENSINYYPNEQKFQRGKKSCHLVTSKGTGPLKEGRPSLFHE